MAETSSVNDGDDIPIRQAGKSSSISFKDLAKAITNDKVGVKLVGGKVSIGNVVAAPTHDGNDNPFLGIGIPGGPQLLTGGGSSLRSDFMLEVVNAAGVTIGYVPIFSIINYDEG